MSRTTKILGTAVIAMTAWVLSTPILALDLNGFVREKGHGDVAISFTAESYDEFWVGSMRVSDPGVGEVDTKSLSVWVAYGLTDNVSLIGSLPWVDTESDGLGGFAESDLQDATLMAAYRFASLGDRVRSNFVGAAGVRTPASNYEANIPVDVGDGTTDWLLRLIYQLQYGGFYFSQQVGYDVRGDDAPDGIPLYTELGYTHGRATYNVFASRLMADDGFDIGESGFTFPGLEEEYLRAGAKAFVRINNRFGMALSVFNTLDGRNTGDASGVSLGLDIGF